MCVGTDELKKNTTVVVCRYCNHQCLPWQAGGVFKWIDAEHRQSIAHCNKCNTIESTYYIEDKELALKIWNETIENKKK